MPVLEKYRNAKRKLLLLDYDGTLVNFTINPEEAKPSVRALNALYRLSRDPAVKVIITTGREYRSIDKLIGHLPLDIIAEHGAMIKENEMWNDRVKMNVKWKQEFLPVFQRFTSECCGSFLEEKRFSLAWHYRALDLLSGHIQSRELIRAIQDKTEQYDLRILDGNRTVEVVTNETDKGHAVDTIISKYQCDFVLSIGDSLTDEDMFKALNHNENYMTVKVGEGRTAAKHRVESPLDVINLLEQL